jgi:aminoglycoside phosphotransferase family enzyme/predicted kinase
VQFGFLDFRERADRQADCLREVALNSRLAPDVYLGVADVVIGGEPVDHLVVMRRMPDQRRLATLARDGRPLADRLDQIAGVLVSFHHAAKRSPDISLAGTAASLWRGWRGNFAETDPFVGPVLDPDIEAEIRDLAFRWIEGRGPLLASRVASGCVCDGHGDLQAEDIFCLDDGPRILDCIEFSEELRYGDVIADVAFLAMDLERLGFAEAAAQFLLRYQELSGDRFPRSLVHHYVASRAYVRSKVACLRSDQGVDGSAVEARHLQALALDHLRSARVSLVIVGGLPGSGKSTLAVGLANARPMTVLRTDAIRTEPTGADWHPNVGRYSRTARSSIYEEMLRRARSLLESGESVVLDASWNDDGHRDGARRLAENTSSDLVELRCVADPREATARIGRRLLEHKDESEATPAVRAAMSRTMDPWPQATTIDTSGAAPSEAVDQALTVMR